MGILRADRVSGLGGANAINGSVRFETGRNKPIFLKIASDDFAVGTGDFTLECWYYKSGLGTHNDAVGNIIMETGNQNGKNGIWLADAQGKLEGRVHYGSGSWNLDITSSSSMSNDRWYHVAMTRSGSTVRIFIDGALEASGSSSSDLTTDYSNEAYVGGQGNSPSNRGIIGYVSNARISNTALYTAAFTVPSARLEKLSSTLLLCCQSSGNVLQEATGKTIVTYVDNINNQGPQASRKTPNSPVGFSTTTDVGSQYGITFEDNTRFDTLSYMVPPGGNSRERNRGRGLIAGGCTPLIAEIEYIQIQSQGNSTTFGNLSATRFGLAGCASATRGLFGGGAEPSIRNYIEFVTIASTGENITDFGDLTAARRDIGALSNQTRGMWTGGNPGSSPNATDTIDFVTIATAGNASDFGNLTASMKEVQSSSSPTRGIMGGGNTVPATVNTIQFITIASTGNASDFGDLTRTAGSLSTASSATRAVFANGGTNTIDYITIASTGNATDFGDTTAVRGQSGGVSNSIRGVFTGGYQPSPTSSDANVIDFIEFATTGNAKDFGDIDRAANDSNREHGTCSDSHGGIS